MLAGTSIGQKDYQSASDGQNPQLFLLINELEADPGNQQNDSCQYIELRGTPGTTVPANTYFVAIDSDPAFTGRLSHVVAIGGVQVGSNGLIYLNNTVAPVCPNRTTAVGTTVVNYNSVIRIGFGTLEVRSESFAVLQTTANIFAGLDIDTNDDGMLDIAVSNISDAVAFRVDPDQEFVYPANSAILGTPFTDVPDAFVRFPGNDSPFTAAAFYFGELASDPVESTVFVAPFSANFPVGGALTPGSPNVPAAPAGSARSDFDGDGRTDLSVFRPSQGIWYNLRSTAGFQAINWGLGTDILVPGDFDGDNITDTAVFRPQMNPAEADFWILRSNGFTIAGLSFGLPNDIPVIGDYDGDGSDDVAVYRPSDTTWYILNSGGGVTVTTFGAAGITPVPADYNGDGRADIATFLNGTWNAQLSGGGSVTVALGDSGDIPVAGDYDGDGTVDQAVFRPSNGSWMIRNSNGGNVTTTQFGLSTDIPVPGDYDGDGREDIAIYRNGQWWLNRSSAGVIVNQFGLSTDIAVVGEAQP